MLTIQAMPSGQMPRLALRSRWWINLDYLTSGLASLLAAIPIALIAGEGWVKAFGITYLCLWAAVLAPSFIVYGWMIIDAVHLFRHRRPTLLGLTLLLRATLMRTGHELRPHGALRRLAKFSMYANPITNLATTLTIQAVRWRADEVEELWRDIHVQVFRGQLSELPAKVSRPAIMASPLLERTSPEFACV